MLTPPESDQNWLGLVSAAATWPRLSVAVAPGAGAISSSAVDDLLQTWTGVVNVPARHTTVVAVMAFSWAAIQAFTPADVLPPAAAVNVCVHEPGGPTGEPVGVCGLGISPSPSAGVFPAGSTGNALAVTGGAGWVMVPVRVRAPGAPGAGAAAASVV